MKNKYQLKYALCILMLSSFNLLHAASISGVVTADNGGALLDNIQVCVTRRAGFSLFECTTTAVDGTYTVGNLPNEDDLIPFINNTNGQLYVLEKYIDREIHDWENSTGVDVSSSNATGINFGLADGFIISGHVSRIDAQVINARVRLYGVGGSKYRWTQATVDGSGDYSAIVGVGSYFALFISNSGLIDELYDGAGAGVHCPRLSCDTTTLGTPIVVSGGAPITGIDGVMDFGSRFSGYLSMDGNLLANKLVLFYTENGEYAGVGGSDATGNYLTGAGYPAGNYIASNRYLEHGQQVLEVHNLEYIAQVYNGTNCGEPCNLLLGDLIALDGTNNVANIDFTYYPIDATVSEQERNALVALYNTTDGLNWVNKTNWLVGDPCSNAWFGIMCIGDAITEVNLVENNLVGTIPSELGHLTALDKLDLGINQLTGTIPPEFVGLTQLKHLYLRENLLSGSFPAFIGSMNSLDNIWISDNLFSGSIPSELGNLTNMTWLTLSRNLFTGTIPLELKNMTNLEKLHLHENQLSGTIPPELSELTNLTQLYLQKNQLEGEIPVSLSLLTNLERLWLNTNNLTGNIPSELGNLSNMQYLFLYSNQLSGDIPSEFGNLNNIIYLYLFANQLTGTIPSEIGNLISLQRLRLYSNQLTDEVPNSLLNLVNLTHFNIGFNALYSSDTNLINFMNGFCGCDWSQNQTTAALNLEVVATSSDSISLNWDTVSYQQHGGYNILMSELISGPFVEIQQTAGKLVNAYTKGDLTAGTAYYFQIQTFTNPHSNPDPLAPQSNLVTSESSETITGSTSLTSDSADLYSEITSDDLLRNTNKGILIHMDIGDLVEYIIVVGNNGPDDAIGAGFRHNFPTGLINTMWTCETNTGSAICPSSNGTEDVDLTLDLPINTSLKFTFTGEVETVDEASLLITSTITPPDGVSDPDLESNDNTTNFEVIFANGFE